MSDSNETLLLVLLCIFLFGMFVFLLGKICVKIATFLPIYVPIITIILLSLYVCLTYPDSILFLPYYYMIVYILILPHMFLGSLKERKEWITKHGSSKSEDYIHRTQIVEEVQYYDEPIEYSSEVRTRTVYPPGIYFISFFSSYIILWVILFLDTLFINYIHNLDNETKLYTIFTDIHSYVFNEIFNILF